MTEPCRRPRGGAGAVLGSCRSIWSPTTSGLATDAAGGAHGGGPIGDRPRGALTLLRRGCFATIVPGVDFLVASDRLTP